MTINDNIKEKDMIIKNFIPASPAKIRLTIKNSDIDVVSVDNFLKDNTPGILYCLNESISSRTSISNLEYLADKHLKLLNDAFPNCPIYLDSAGFQIAGGRFEKDVIDEYIPKFHETLKTERYLKAFTLDIPPSETFDSYSEIKAYNDKSYKMSAEKNDGRMIFVFHAHDIELYKIWNNLFDKYHEAFNYFSVGGVARGCGQNRIVTYALLFKIILNKCIQNKMDEIDLHILGAGRASTILTFLFMLAKFYIREKYGINFKLTTDSCQHPRLTMAKKYSTIYNGSIHTFEWFSRNLKMKFMGKTRIEYILDEINNFAQTNKINITIDQLYTEKGTIDLNFYGIELLRDIQNYIDIQEIIYDAVVENIDVFLNHDYRLPQTCSEIIKRLNGGRLTKQIKRDCCNITNFLNILDSNDEKMILHLLEKNHTDMFLKDKILTV